MTNTINSALTELQVPGFTLYEPMTAFTDLILSVLCLILGIRLSNQNLNEHPGIRNWAACFRFLSVTTGMGAIIHGFIPDRSTSIYIVSWLTMQVISGIAVFYAQCGSVFSGSEKDKNRILPVIFTLQLIIFVTAALLFKSFYAVVINSAAGIASIFYFQLKFYTNRPESASRIILGFTISFSVIGVYLAKLSMFSWLNYLDIAHLIMMASLVIIYKGVTRLQVIPHVIKNTN